MADNEVIPVITYPVMVDIQIAVQDEEYADSLLDAMSVADSKGDIRVGVMGRVPLETYTAAHQKGQAAQVAADGLHEAVLNWVLEHRANAETGRWAWKEDETLYTKWLAFVAATKGD